MKTAEIPPDADLIGCNRSYEYLYAPVWCTVDYIAYETAFRHWDEGRYPAPETVYARKTALNRVSTPLPIPNHVRIVPVFDGNSGLFAVHVTRIVLKYEQVYLVGFDPWDLGNFYGNTDPKYHLALRSERKTLRKKLWKLAREPGPEIFLWTRPKQHRNGSYKPLIEAIDWDKLGQSLS